MHVFKFLRCFVPATYSVTCGDRNFCLSYNNPPFYSTIPMNYLVVHFYENVGASKSKFERVVF